MFYMSGHVERIHIWLITGIVVVIGTVVLVFDIRIFLILLLTSLFCLKYRVKDVADAIGRMITEEKPLSSTLIHDEYKICELLLILGYRETNILHQATRLSAVKCISVLTPRFYDPNYFESPNECFPPLQTCTVLGFISVASTLMKAGADPLRSGKDQFNAIHTAAACGRARLLKMYIDHIEKTNNMPVSEAVSQQTRFKQTALHLASNEGNVTCLTILLSYSPQLNTRDFKKRTPFDVAVTRMQLQCAKLLLSHGALATCNSNVKEFQELIESFPRIPSLTKLSSHAVKSNRKIFEKHKNRLPAHLSLSIFNVQHVEIIAE